MGTCLSKKSTTANAKCTTPTAPTPQEVKVRPNPEKTKNAAIVATEQQVPKKEIFVIQHRISRAIDRHPDHENPNTLDKKNPNASTDLSPSAAVSNGESGKAGGVAVKTSSCTKEEVDVILTRCGKLSRSTSTAGAETPSRGRRYSVSKRSYDFDLEVDLKNEDDELVVDDCGVDHHHHRHRQREPRASSPSSRRSRRERDPLQQGSGSKERGSGGGRRVSRSPNQRSESPFPNSNGSGGSSAASGASSNRPGKIVSVPATDKSNNAGGGDVVASAAAAAGGGVVRRIHVKRNVGEAMVAVGSRSTASPRSRSPARTNLRVSNENQNQEQRRQQPSTLSQSNSRKAEHSPYRRNPLAEIDNNVVGSEQPGNKAQMQIPNSEKITSNNFVTMQMVDEAKMTVVVPPGVENLKLHQNIKKKCSSRLSRDMDINPESLLNPNQPSYASLLLEDIHNFHQKNTTTATAAPAFSLPACVSKACSILEAVADLTSTNSNNNPSSSLFLEDRWKTPMTTGHQLNEVNLVESEMVVSDDMMKPSLDKYVTVRRGVSSDTEEQESSGSNSFAGSRHLNWLPCEPNSSSRSNARENELSQLGGFPRNGIGRDRIGGDGRSAYSMPNNITVDST